MEPLLTAPKPHPLRWHRPRVSNRAAMDAILLAAREHAAERARWHPHLHLLVAYQWFREWIDAGVIAAF